MDLAPKRVMSIGPHVTGLAFLQDTFLDPSLRLFTDNGIFFEFAPVEQIDPDNPDDWDRTVETFTADQVETGQHYVRNGLFRKIVKCGDRARERLQVC